MALRVGHVRGGVEGKSSLFLSLSLLLALPLGGKLPCCHFIDLLSFFGSVSFFFSLRGKERGWDWDLRGGGLGGEDFWWGISWLGGGRRGIKTSLFWAFSLRPRREAVYINNRLRTGTDKGNPTV